MEATTKEAIMARIALYEARGPLNALNDALSGEDGDMVLGELKKFLRKEPTWIPAESPPPPPKPAHVADGVVFELTLNFDAPEVQPLEMVRRDGYSGDWKHNGATLAGTQTRKFKWVAIGECRNFDEVKRKLAKHGRIPEGQWREAVKATFEHDGVHPRGIADTSWVGPDGDARFPYVYSGGHSFFYWSGLDFRVGWRWLVEVSE